jgi:hypothetical protein
MDIEELKELVPKIKNFNESDMVKAILNENKKQKPSPAPRPKKTK